MHISIPSQTQCEPHESVLVQKEARSPRCRFSSAVFLLGPAAILGFVLPRRHVPRTATYQSKRTDDESLSYKSSNLSLVGVGEAYKYSATAFSG